jgi:hypothetical protein
VILRSTAGRLPSPVGEVTAVASEHDQSAGTERGPTRQRDELFHLRRLALPLQHRLGGLLEPSYDSESAHDCRLPCGRALHVHRRMMITHRRFRTSSESVERSGF